MENEPAINVEVEQPFRRLKIDVTEIGAEIREIVERHKAICVALFYRHSFNNEADLPSYLWAHRSCKFEELEFQTDIGQPTITDWLNFFRDICAEYFIRNPSKLVAKVCVK